MAEEQWAGHHCKRCYEQHLERARYRARPTKAQLAKELEEERRRHAAVKAASEARQNEIFRRIEERERAERLKPPPIKEHTFAKSLNVPKDQVCFPAGEELFEGLWEYGKFAVLSTSTAITHAGTPLELIDGSGSAVIVAARTGGLFSLGLSELALGAGAGLVSGAVAGTVAMLWPNTFSSDSAFYSSEEFANLTVANIGVRVTVKYLPEESVSAFGVYTGKYPGWRKVPVIAAAARGEQLVADVGQGVELIWTPAVDPLRVLGIPALEGAPYLKGVFVFPVAEEAERMYSHPAQPPDFQDAIIWFPSRPEIPPVYISLNLRGAPGVATGLGQDVTGIWLAGAGAGLGAPVPTRVADRLRGREFVSFDAFRRAFWIGVGNDPELSGQFNQDNIKRLARGLAPTARMKDQVGKRISYELHHRERVVDGGAVYDADNLGVNTPKNHIDIHKETR